MTGKGENLDAKVDTAGATKENSVRNGELNLGNIYPFINDGNVKFDHYLWSVQNYFKMNKIVDGETQVRMLLNLIGDTNSEKIRNSCLPKDPVEFSYEEIVEKCTRLFCGEKNEILETFVFNSRNQKEGEEVYKFAIELQILAKECNFGTSYRDRVLRDRFVVGIADCQIRGECLKLGSKATFDQVVKEACRQDSIMKNARKMQGDDANINGIERGNGSRRTQSGFSRYRRERAYARSRSRSFSPERNGKREKYEDANDGKSGREKMRCFKCDGVGHFARKCPSRFNGNAHQQRRGFHFNRNRNSYSNTNMVGSEEEIGKMLKPSELENIFSSTFSSGINMTAPIQRGSSETPMKKLVDYCGIEMKTRGVDPMFPCFQVKQPEKLNDEEIMRKLEEYTGGMEVDETGNLLYEEELLLENSENKEEEIYSLVCSIGNFNSREMMNLVIENQEVSMEIDSGAVVSVCPEILFRKHFAHKKVYPARLPLRGVNGTELNLIGQIVVGIKINGMSHKLPLVILESHSNGTMLMGRNWLDKIVPHLRNAFKINGISGDCEQFLSRIKKDYASVFKDDISEPIEEFKVDIRLTDDATPVIHKPYPVPFSLKEKVEKELERLCNENIIQKVEKLKWGSPIVVVPKQSGEIRICGNYAVTINPYIRTDHYQIPIIDDILANVGGHSYYCVIDLKGVFTQLELSEGAKQILGISTHKGFYIYNRMSFGKDIRRNRGCSHIY